MSIKRIGILGAGRAGTALARAAAAAGIEVRIAGSRPPRMMKYHLAQYASRATGVLAEEIAEDVDLVVLMVPQEELGDIDVSSLAGILLVDATNRWEDEPLPDWLEASLDAGLSSSEGIAARFKSSRVVKALNHISHWDMDADRATKQSAQRALSVAADNAQDAQMVSELTKALGFSPVQLPSLAAGRVLEPQGPVFNQVLDAESLRRLSGTQG
ncbi:NADPH-dependent F420 reductase [Glutamicibacter mysorens]|uniref:NADPH-dependent F420 reductase n=1 Tax=Glutamicibacter mysorens TaxID=257984 RepID=UPI0020C6C56F|nr:NAD(P)-binding domain-containing protein [Glutamicibacter mysorens]UTM47356.1 NAD(P)-binding domain-containing protein [Glutamicibacter mysorens]